MSWTVWGLLMAWGSLCLHRRYLGGGGMHYVAFLTMFFALLGLFMSWLSPRIRPMTIDRLVELLIDQMRREDGENHEATVGNDASGPDQSAVHPGVLERTERRSTRRSTHGLGYHGTRSENSSSRK